MNYQNRTHLVGIMLNKFFETNNLDDLTDEVADRIRSLANKLLLAPTFEDSEGDVIITSPTPPLDTHISKLRVLPGNIRFKLSHAGIKSLGALTECSTTDLLKLNSFGGKSLKLVSEYLKSINLKLKDE